MLPIDLASFDELLSVSECGIGFQPVICRTQAGSLIFTHISIHTRTINPMDLREYDVFSPPRPVSGRGVRGVRGRIVTCKSPVQGFVQTSETWEGIAITTKNPIKTQCKTPHPQPLSKMWVMMRALAHGYNMPPFHGYSQCYKTQFH